MTAPQTPPAGGFHMTPAQFREHGRAVVDWIADYWEHLEDYPVLAQVAPGAVTASLPEHPPIGPEPFDVLLRDMTENVLPGITHWQAPSFFAYFPANVSGPSVLGDLLSSGLGVQGMLWTTSPAATEVESKVLDWLAELLDLPPAFRSNGGGGGVIQDSASSASLCALLAARERATGGQTNAQGMAGRRLTAYVSDQAHSSLEKAARITGLGSAHLRTVRSHPGTLAMDPEALAAAVRADIDAGATPFFVCATVGTTSTHAIDPLPAIGRVAREHGLWLHVDAAHAGTAAVCPEHRWIHEGLDAADSYVVNPHKWMFTNFDCSAFFVRDRGPLVAALSILPDYLRNPATESGAVIDYRDWQVPLGRRFRALKLWAVLRWYGAEGLRHHVREHVALAQELADRVRADDQWRLATDPPLSLVCLRHVDGERRTQQVIDRVNASGKAFLTHTRVGGDLVLRVSVGGTWTERRHVEALWLLLQQAAGAD